MEDTSLCRLIKKEIKKRFDQHLKRLILKWGSDTTEHSYTEALKDNKTAVKLDIEI